MWIIEHSTTPHDLVNSLSHCGTKSQKNTVRITALLLPSMPYKTTGLPIRPGFRTRPATRGRKNFLKPNAAYAPRQIQLGIELDFLEGRRKVRLTKNRLPACKTRSSSLAGIGSWLFALGSILSFIASSLTLSKQTAYQVLCRLRSRTSSRK